MKVIKRKITLFLTIVMTLLCITQSGSQVYATELFSMTGSDYYASSLKLLKNVTTIYTTQTKVPVAEIKLSNFATENDNIYIEDSSYNRESNKESALQLDRIGSDLMIYASASENTALGKHVIRVVADSQPGVQAAEASITVNVVQGIEPGMVSMAVASDTYYKEEGKNLKFNAKALYVKDDETGKLPQKRKVNWEIFGADGRSISVNSPLFNKISIKNGRVTVDKSYIVSDKKEENRFIINLKAADYDTNHVSVSSQMIEITDKKEETGEVIIVRQDVSGNWMVTARNDMSITSDKLGQIRLLKKMSPLKDIYTSEELDEYTFRPSNLSYKSSNKNIKIDSLGYVSAVKPVKKTNVTVTLNDNSKQKVKLENLAVTYKDTTEIGIRVEHMNEVGEFHYIGDTVSGNINWAINSYTNNNIRITMLQKLPGSDEWQEVDSHVNYKLTVKDGKIYRKDGLHNQIYYLGMNKKSITIKLNDKAKKETYTYTIINTGFPEGEAPLLTTKDSIRETNNEREQILVYDLKKRGNFYYDFNSKYVYVAADYADMYAKPEKTFDYYQFEQAMGGFGVIPLNGNTISVSFNTTKEKPLPDGKYKLWLTFGEMDENGIFNPDTQMISVTVNVKKANLKVGKFKANGKYNFSIKEGGLVTLKGSGSHYDKYSLSFENLKDTNIGGKPNHFTKYFEVHNKILQLRDGITLQELEYIQSEKAKKDLTGYVDYSVYLRDKDGSYFKEYKSVRISLSLKESVHVFTMDSVNAHKDDVIVQAKVYASGKQINILHAVTESGTYQAKADGSSVLTLEPNKNTNSPTEGENNLVIYVIPETTIDLYKAELSRLQKQFQQSSTTENQKAYNNAIKKYGIKVNGKVSIPVVDLGNRDRLFKVAELVNAERRKAGLKALEVHEDLMFAASIRAKELPKLFSHTRPDNRSWSTVFKEAYIDSYKSAGENIAMGYKTPEAVMTGWMNSSGHRANILNSNFTHIGVGCVEKDGSLYWVQLFMGK